MRRIAFHKDAWEDFTNWHSQDRKIFERIVRIINETARDPFTGIGKPEPLRHELKGFWSRRINDEHRLVYQITDAEIVIAACKFHYQ
jgi:toxin YoeB